MDHNAANVEDEHVGVVAAAAVPGEQRHGRAGAEQRRKGGAGEGSGGDHWDARA